MPDPSVTLILAVRNEEAHIARAVASVLAQDYPRDRLQVVLADGDSTDATIRVAQSVDADGRVEIIRNPRQAMPFGLNAAIDIASGQYIGSVIGHSTIPPDYVRRCVEVIERTGASAIGGRYVRRGTTPTQRAIAAVTSHPLGVGDSRHNYGDRAGWVETAFPGFWRRDIFERLGPFDPAMVVNEDNELALRIRRAGGRIWYEPSIGVEYAPRSSFAALFHQYRRYAVGKVAVFRKHRAGLAWRHLTPAGWMAWVIVGGSTVLAAPALTPIWLIGMAAYVSAVIAVSLRLAGPGIPWWRIASAFATLHAAYGIGLWQGVLRWIIGR